MLARDFANDTRYQGLLATPANNCAGIVGINSLQRRREKIRIAFAAHFAIGDYVHARALLISNGKECRVILRLIETIPDPPRQSPREPPAPATSLPAYRD